MLKKNGIQILKQIICLCMVAVVMAPILLTLFAALKTKADMVTTSPLLLPAFSKITFENFAKVLSDKYLILGFRNTALILLISLFFNVIFIRNNNYGNIFLRLAILICDSDNSRAVLCEN